MDKHISLFRKLLGQAELKSIPIIIIAIFCINPSESISATKALLVDSGPIDREDLEKIFSEGKPLKGALQNVQVSLNNCVLRVRLTYNRTCGTDFDSSYVLNREYVLDLRNYKNPVFFEFNKTISFEYNNNHNDKNEAIKSTDTIRLCTGRNVIQNNPFFLIEVDSNDMRESIETKYHKIQKYVNDNCR